MCAAFGVQLSHAQVVEPLTNLFTSFDRAEHVVLANGTANRRKLFVNLFVSRDRSHVNLLSNMQGHDAGRIPAWGINERERGR